MRLRRSWVLAALVVVSLAISALQAAGTVRLPLLQQLENALDDARARWFANGRHDARIAIVDIDEASLDELGRWPWPRDRLARLVEELYERQRVAVVGFDLLFAEPDVAELSALERMAADDPALARSLPRLRATLDRDAAFARATHDRSVVLGYYFTSDRAGHRSGTLPEPVMRDGAGLGAIRWTGYAGNLPSLVAAADSAGFFNFFVDADGVVRSLPVLAELDGQVYESLALGMFRAYGGAPSITPDTVTVGGVARLRGLTLTQGDVRVSVPTSVRATARVPYRGQGGPKAGIYDYVSAADLVGGRLPPGQLQGRLVLIGTSVPSLADLRATPLEPVYPGVEVHASLLSGLLDGRIPWEPDWALAYELALLTVTALVLGLSLPRLRAAPAVALTLTLAAAAIGLNLALYALRSWVLPLSPPLLLIGLVYLADTSWGYIAEGRRRRQITKLFGAYVPPELVRKMARDPARYDMQAENRVLTVMFCDVRGFTTVSETLEPQALRELINLFFSRMTAIIRAHRGTLDKYIGDAIMAFWGAPVDDPDHARNAVWAALSMAQAMDDLNREFRERGLPPIALGIGLNTGLVCVGDMGSDIRRSYTVMGDAVNLASRIEGLTRQYGVAVLAGEATREAAGDPPGLSWREVDRVRVKGREASVTVFTPQV